MALMSRLIGTVMFDRIIIEDIKVSSTLQKEAIVLMLIAWFGGIIVNYLSSGGNWFLPLGFLAPYVSSLIGSSFLTISLTNPLLEFGFSFIFQAVFTLTWFFVATIVGNVFMGDQASFWQIFRCMAYSYTISLLKLIPSVLIFLTLAVEAASLLNLLIILWAVANTVYVLGVCLDANIFMAVVICLIGILTAGIVILLGGMIILPMINVS